MICLLKDTIADVKGKIEESEGISVLHQVLSCGEDHVSLKEANITTGTLLDVGKYIITDHRLRFIKPAWWYMDSNLCGPLYV